MPKLGIQSPFVFHRKEKGPARW